MPFLVGTPVTIIGPHQC